MKIVAKNKKAEHDYEILETFEAGLVLRGMEVKSVRNRNVSIKDSYAQIEGGEVYLKNMHISNYSKSSEDIDPRRDRKLLLHSYEIQKIDSKIKKKGLTLIPLSVYIKNGLIKVLIALARGKSKYEKRDKIIEKEQKRRIKKHL